MPYTKIISVREYYRSRPTKKSLAQKYAQKPRRRRRKKQQQGGLIQ